MRKVFSCIVLLFIGFLAFSETGYNGVQWKSTVEQVSAKTLITVDPIEREILSNPILKDNYSIEGIFHTNKIILGKETNVSYYFENDYLNNRKFTGICYELDRKDLKALQKKYKTKPLVYKSETNTDINVLIEESGIKTIFDILNPNKDVEINNEIISFFVKYILYGTSYITETYGTNNKSFKELNLTQEKIKNPAGTLYIYDYNSDTRVYIYDNIIKDKAVVVYVPHEQDY